MDENMYRSPEVVNEWEGEMPEWVAERQRMEKVAFGLGLNFWGTLVQVAGAFVVGVAGMAYLMGRLGTTEIGEYDRTVNVLIYVGMLPGCLVTFLGALRCMQCPESVAWNAKRLVLLSVIFCGVEFPLLMMGEGPVLELLTCVLAAGCAGTWCLFLWRLAAGVRNEACVWRAIYALTLGVGFNVLAVLALFAEQAEVFAPETFVSEMISLLVAGMALAYIILELAAMWGLKNTISGHLTRWR